MPSESSRLSTNNKPQPPYGTAIHNAIATGDLAKMKALALRAEQFLAEHGNVASALEVLKIEIAKIEARGH